MSWWKILNTEDTEDAEDAKGRKGRRGRGEHLPRSAVAIFTATDDNPYVAKGNELGEVSNGGSPFVCGAIVVVWLGNPRERFWGMLLDLSPSGLSIRGIDLNSFEDFVSLLRRGEPTTPGEVFFPMHRVERIELDQPSGELPSLSDRFETGTGQAAATVLGPDYIRSVPKR